MGHANSRGCSTSIFVVLAVCSSLVFAVSDARSSVPSPAVTLADAHLWQLLPPEARLLENVTTPADRSFQPAPHSRMLQTQTSIRTFQACDDVVKQPGPERCVYAREHCEADGLLNYVELYYCHAAPAGWVPAGAMLLLCALGLGLTFRLLASTADDFFSPILTKLSQEMGLPPRLAGVTFLALGNGAPDLSSSIAAVKSGHYQLAMGAQMGAGMFIGCVVAGGVMLVADGAKVRGATVRDTSAYLLAVVAVAVMLHSTRVGRGDVALLLGGYLLFVFTVFAADIYHRLQNRLQPVLTPPSDGMQQPLLSGAEREDDDDEGQMVEDSTGREASLAAGLSAGEEQLALRKSPSGGGSSGSCIELVDAQPPSPIRRSKFSKLDSIASSSYQVSESSAVGSPPAMHTPFAAPAAQQGNDATNSIRVSADLPRPSAALFSGGGQRRRSTTDIGRIAAEAQAARPATSGLWGISAPVAYEDLLLMPRRTYRDQALAELAHSQTFFTTQQEAQVESAALAEELALLQALKDRSAPAAAPSSSHYACLPDVLDAASSGREEGEERDEEEGGAGQWLGGQRRRVQRSLSHITSTSYAHLQGLHTRYGGQVERAGDAVMPLWVALVRLYDVAEAPFTLARRATIPLLERETYSRTWFLAAAACAPPALLLYLGLPAWSLLPAAAVGAACAAAAFLGTRHTKEEPPTWSCGLPFPVGAAAVTTAGFALAVMWIDTIASELVGLLNFLGILSGIPHSVLGLTILAWGNSLCDLTTNLAMARKGLSNMAMTACFAGPVFNLLVGIGLGFLTFLGVKHQAAAEVVLAPAVLLGAAFIVLNCTLIIVVGLLNRQRLPANYGIFSLVLYGVYLLTTLVVMLVYG